MKKLVFIIALLIGFSSIAQKHKVEVLKKKYVTTTERDLYVVPSGEVWEIFNTTTGQSEKNIGGAGWILDGAGAGNLSPADQAKLDNIAIANNIDLDALLAVASSALQAEVDGSITNEIQNLSNFSFNATTNVLSLSIVDGNTVTVDLSALVGSVTETDPIYGASQAPNLTAQHITDLNNLSGVNSGDQNASQVSVTPSGNLGATDAQSAFTELQNDINNLTSGGADGNDYLTSVTESSDIFTFNVPNQTNPTFDFGSYLGGKGYLTSETDDQEADEVVYSGSVAGATNVEIALDSLQSIKGDFKADGSVVATDDFDLGNNDIENIRFANATLFQGSNANISSNLKIPEKSTGINPSSANSNIHINDVVSELHYSVNDTLFENVNKRFLNKALGKEQIRDSLTALTGADKLDASAIKNLPTGGNTITRAEKAMRKELDVNYVIVSDSRGAKGYNRRFEHATEQLDKVNIDVDVSAESGQSITNWLQSIHGASGNNRGTLNQTLSLIPNTGLNSIVAFDMGWNDTGRTVAQYEQLYQEVYDSLLINRPDLELHFISPYPSAATGKDADLETSMSNVAVANGIKYINLQSELNTVKADGNYYWDDTHQAFYGSIRGNNLTFEQSFVGNVLKHITLTDPVPYATGQTGGLANVRNDGWKPFANANPSYGQTTRRSFELIDNLVYNAVLQIDGALTNAQIVFFDESDNFLSTFFLSRYAKDSNKFEFTVPKGAKSAGINISNNGAQYDAAGNPATVIYKVNPVTLTQEDINEGLVLTMPYVATSSGSANLQYSGVDNEFLSAGDNNVEVPIPGRKFVKYLDVSTGVNVLTEANIREGQQEVLNVYDAATGSTIELGNIGSSGDFINLNIRKNATIEIEPTGTAMFFFQDGTSSHDTNGNLTQIVDADGQVSIIKIKNNEWDLTGNYTPIPYAVANTNLYPTGNFGSPGADEGNAFGPWLNNQLSYIVSSPVTDGSFAFLSMNSNNAGFGGHTADFTGLDSTKPTTVSIDLNQVQGDSGRVYITEFGNNTNLAGVANNPVFLQDTPGYNTITFTIPAGETQFRIRLIHSVNAPNNNDSTLDAGEEGVAVDNITILQ